MTNQFCSNCRASLMPTMRVCPTCGGKDFSALAPQTPPVPMGSVAKQGQFRSPLPSSNTSTLITPTVLAARGSRLGAAALDFLFYALSVTPGSAMFSKAESDIEKGIAAAVIGVGFIAIALTQWFYLIKRGQSLGKRVLGMLISIQT